MGIDLREQGMKLVEAPVVAARSVAELGWRAGTAILQRTVVDPAVAAAHFAADMLGPQTEYIKNLEHEAPLHDVKESIHVLDELNADKAAEPKKKAAVAYMVARGLQKIEAIPTVSADTTKQLAQQAERPLRVLPSDVIDILPQGTLVDVTLKANPGLEVLIEAAAIPVWDEKEPRQSPEMLQPQSTGVRASTDNL